MNKCGLIALLAAVSFVGAPAAAEEDVQWIRVTVLLEPASGATHRAEESLIPGGVYSPAEVDRRGRDAIDQEILERVRFLGESMRGVEESMRLATLLARQYYLPLEVGEEAVLPAIDLNPRLGIVFTPLRFVGNRAVCKVQFLEPEGPEASPDFTGEPITLRLQDADLQDVLQVFAKITETVIEIDPSVDAEVSVDLRNVPWDQALDLILRVNNLGWVKENGGLRIAPLDELSRRKRVRTDATINLPRGSWGSATIASRGDSVNPTAVLIVESVDGEPFMVAERTGLVRPDDVRLVLPTAEDAGESIGEIVVVRGTVNQDGTIGETAVLASPSAAYTARFSDVLEDWSFRPAFDEQGRREEAVVGFGLRLTPTRGLASIGAVEHVGVELKVGPPSPELSDKYPDHFVVTAYVSDLETREVISAPRISVRKGDEGTIRAGFVAPSGEPSKVEMKVFVSADGNRVRSSWTITTDGKIVSSHKAEFEL